MTGRIACVSEHPSRPRGDGATALGQACGRRACEQERIHRADLREREWPRGDGSSCPVRACLFDFANKVDVGQRRVAFVYRSRVAAHFGPAGLHAYLDTQVGHEATARLLLDKRADVAHKNKDGWTALIFASENGHEGTEQLCSSGMPWDVSDHTVYLRQGRVASVNRNLRTST